MMENSSGKFSSTSRRSVGSIYIGRMPDSPIGPIWVAVSQLGLITVEWDLTGEDFSRWLTKRFQSTIVYDEERTTLPRHEINEYLNGKRHHFDLPLDLTRLSPFQKQVLQLTMLIPFAQTMTYQQIASQAGKPQAARAVGRAEATNPIPLVIPCHRVIGSDGSLHGYGGPGGIKLKAWLLQLERNSL